MDPAFAKKYLRNFDALEKQKDGTPGLAVQTKAVVTASVQSSGVVDAESDVARVLVFVNVRLPQGRRRPPDLPEPGRDDHAQGRRPLAGQQRQLY